MEPDLFAEPNPAESWPPSPAARPHGLPLYIGTSSWSSEDWRGIIYPTGARASDFLSFYAQRYPAVEIDMTFYRIPTPRMVDSWYRKTPAEFRFAAKVPQLITHEKILRDCQEDLRQFAQVMGGLGEKLGPLLLQFPYFSKRRFASPQGFLEHLEPFLDELPQGFRFAVEIRNRRWITPRLLDMLRAHHVALALTDHPWMPSLQELTRHHDVVTTDFVYIRWLGDRQAIEAVTQKWDRLIVDRRQETAAWVAMIRQFLAQRLAVYGFYNNHYAGHSPGSIALFHELWKSQNTT